MSMYFGPRFFLLSLLSMLLFLSPSLSRADEEEPSGGPTALKRLKFRNIGPAAGGRVCRAAGVPGDPLTYYAATAASGLWKTSDGGQTWKPIMDEMPTATLGSLAIAPSDPNVIYVGSGEANIRGNVEVGNGIYKSTDAGKTWKHVWKQEGQIGTLIVHPTNPDIAYAAVLGKIFGPNPERGVYRTTDGGATWKKVLFKDADTGASDICFDPANPRILFAGLWQTRRRPWEMTSGGAGSGLYFSRDAGDTWTQLVAPPKDDSPDKDKEAAPGTRRAKGLPPGIWGKIGLAVAPSDSKRVYALIEAEEGGLFRSNDAGVSWEKANDNRALRQRAWYFSTLTVDPKNADIIWFPQVPLFKSIDGGKSLLRVKGAHHGDHHDLWIDPSNPRRIIDSNDGGVDISTNGGETWYAPPLPIAQFYHLDVDNSEPYQVAGSMQDIGTACGPNNTINSRGIPLSAWHHVGGGEAGHAVFHPKDNNIVYAGEYSGYISRYDHRTRQSRSIGIYPFDASGHGGEDLKYRFQWTAPILASKQEPGTVYHAANVLFVTRDDGKKWTAISPDLTRNDKSKQKWSGGPITGDNTGVEIYCTIFALAESPRKKGVLWAGSDDGLVHVTQDGGKTWEKVTPKGLPEWATITCIEASPFEETTAYVVADAHRMDDRKPYLFRTNDFGKTWESLTEKIGVDGFLNVVREDPSKKGILYVGWEQGLVYSTDDGKTWEPLKLNFPPVRVTDLVVKGNDLVVSTNGRSIWILDDLTPLRQFGSEEGKRIKENVHLFPPRNAIRYYSTSQFENKLTPGWKGTNPPQGAIIHYHLKSQPAEHITLTIKDARGKVVRTLSSKKKPPEPPDEGAYDDEEEGEPVLARETGLHRLVWDLRHKGAHLIHGARVDSGDPQTGPLVVPGTYTLELTVAGKTVTEKLDVLPDPRPAKAVVARLSKLNGGSPITPSEQRSIEEQLLDELKEQEKLALQIRDDINRVTETVERLRAVRKQIKNHEVLLKNDATAKSLLKKSKTLLDTLDGLESKLHNPKAKVSYDILAQKGGAQLYSQLAWCLELIKDGDGAPNQGLLELYADQRKLLEKYTQQWDEIVKKDIAELNDEARKLELPGLIIPKKAKKEEKE